MLGAILGGRGRSRPNGFETPWSRECGWRRRETALLRMPVALVAATPTAQSIAASGPLQSMQTNLGIEAADILRLAQPGAGREQRRRSGRNAMAEDLRDALSRVQAPHKRTKEAVAGTNHTRRPDWQRRRVEGLLLRYQHRAKMAERQCNRLRRCVCNEIAGGGKRLLPSWS
jgi:hypothetical protein